MTLSKRDKQIIWHPFTQEKTASEVIAVKSASGSYIYDEKGKAYSGEERIKPPCSKDVLEKDIAQGW